MSEWVGGLWVSEWVGELLSELVCELVSYGSVSDILKAHSAPGIKNNSKCINSKWRQNPFFTLQVCWALSIVWDTFKITPTFGNFHCTDRFHPPQWYLIGSNLEPFQQLNSYGNHYEGPQRWFGYRFNLKIIRNICLYSDKGSPVRVNTRNVMSIK